MYHLLSYNNYYEYYKYNIIINDLIGRPPVTFSGKNIFTQPEKNSLNFNFRVKTLIIKLKADNIPESKTVPFFIYSKYNVEYIVQKERPLQQF